MTFEPPDEARFPALGVARDAGRHGPGATAALIAADDVAVARFLEGSLAFPGIPTLVAEAVARFSVPVAPELEELEAIDSAVRAWSRDVRI